MDRNRTDSEVYILDVLEKQWVKELQRFSERFINLNNRSTVYRTGIIYFIETGPWYKATNPANRLIES